MYSDDKVMNIPRLNAIVAILVAAMFSMVAGAVTQTSTPAFSPSGGTYSSVRAVAIGDTTANSTIYYTTDGTTPSTSSHRYSGPITVSASMTIKAIATASGHTQSGVASAAYTIQASTPAFSPAGGTYSSTQAVTISDATANSTIYYTTDGATPATSSDRKSTRLNSSPSS